MRERTSLREGLSPVVPTGCHTGGGGLLLPSLGAAVTSRVNLVNHSGFSQKLSRLLVSQRVPGPLTTQQCGRPDSTTHL